MSSLACGLPIGDTEPMRKNMLKELIFRRNSRIVLEKKKIVFVPLILNLKIVCSSFRHIQFIHNLSKIHTSESLYLCLGIHFDLFPEARRTSEK